MASGKKGRKIGNKKKQPAMKRYTAEMRWVKNKARKAKKEEKKRIKKQAHLQRWAAKQKAKRVVIVVA